MVRIHPLRAGSRPQYYPHACPTILQTAAVGSSAHCPQRGCPPMNPMTLYIGSKWLSSWSLRPWPLMRHHELAFAESLITLVAPDKHTRILTHSPTGRSEERRVGKGCGSTCRTRGSP